MTYLLDVNALLALGFQQHEFHHRVASWVARARQPLLLATCSISELGFVRVLAQAPAYGLTILQARTLLMRLKKADAPLFTFVTDSHDASHLPAWVKTGRQITDGHLAQLARANAAVLATLDAKISDAFLIPNN
jgi:predicted nucleic acid-binding protein